MTTTAPFSVMQEGTSGDISSGPGQLGRTVFMNSVGTNLDQTADFDSRYYYRYSIENTTDITFTLAVIDSEVYRGYTFILHNRATSTGYIQVTYTTYSFSPTLKVIQIQPGEAYILTAELFNGSVDIWVVARFLLTGLFVQNTTFVDDVYGDDATGEFERPDRAFKTISAGAAATPSNSIILIRPGVYSESSSVVLADIVDVYFQAGARLITTGTSVFSNAGFTATCSIIGEGVIIGSNSVVFANATSSSGLVILEALQIIDCTKILTENMYVYNIENEVANDNLFEHVGQGGYVDRISYFPGATQSIVANNNCNLIIDYLETNNPLTDTALANSYVCVNHYNINSSTILFGGQSNVMVWAGVVNAPGIPVTLTSGTVDVWIETLVFGYGGSPSSSSFISGGSTYIGKMVQTTNTGSTLLLTAANVFINDGVIRESLDGGADIWFNNLDYTETGSLGALTGASLNVRGNNMTVMGGSAMYALGGIVSIRRLSVSSGTITASTCTGTIISLENCVCTGSGTEYLFSKTGETVHIGTMTATNIAAMFAAGGIAQSYAYFERLSVPAVVDSTATQFGLFLMGDFLTTSGVALTVGANVGVLGRGWYVYVKKVSAPQLFVRTAAPTLPDAIDLFCDEAVGTGTMIDLATAAGGITINIGGHFKTSGTTVVDLQGVTVVDIRFVRTSLINTGAGSPVARSGAAIVAQNHGPLMVRVAIPASVFSTVFGSATLVNTAYS
ncbi:hypothetical protein KDA11_03890 [Candidatus Saccharibacteria bacterium]|nr:hypothetical protein [Candidatus Saccharibacteria bacterium]